jgi:CheY-like chemotaxis protein
VSLSDMLQSAREVIAPLLEREGLILRVDAPPTLPQIRGDPAILRQIVLHGLTEAVGLAAGKELHLVVRCYPGEVTYTLGDLDAGRLRAKDPAADDGWQMIRSLLSAYGGTLWIEEDEPAAISLSLPVLACRAILIVDDDADTRNLYQRFLRGEGYIVRVAANARAVKEALSDSRPHLVLLDVLMPQEDGWDILRDLKATTATAAIPVVICSVLTQPQLALAIGAAAVLHKPIPPETLLQTIRAALLQADSAA